VRIVVTGGQGFIGSQLVRTLLQSGHAVLNLDKGTYAAHPGNLLEIEDDPAYSKVEADIADAPKVRHIFQTWRPDAVVNAAAETHVDRSIRNATGFLTTNVIGVQVLLDTCRELHVAPFLQISTDEVMGSTPPGARFNEATPLAPSNPYSASKAAAELMIRAAVQTHGIDARIVRSANNYGPRQYPEKLIPLMILRALEGQPLPLYGDGLHVRDWIHVEDHARAVQTVLEWGEPGGVYCVGARTEFTNRQIVEAILNMLHRPLDLIEPVPDRPGHDRRYAIDPSRIEALGWRPRIGFESGLWDTVRWYSTHTSWLESVRVGAYQNFHAGWVKGR
jgi:dTDP-glucose 4,6-dehydratase